MKIAVLIKEVPDTWSHRRIDLATGLADRETSDPVIDEIKERALEVALRHDDANGGEVVVSMGLVPPRSPVCPVAPNGRQD